MPFGPPSLNHVEWNIQIKGISANADPHQYCSSRAQKQKWETLLKNVEANSTQCSQAVDVMHQWKKKWNRRAIYDFLQKWVCVQLYHVMSDWTKFDYTLLRIPISYSKLRKRSAESWEWARSSSPTVTDFIQFCPEIIRRFCLLNHWNMTALHENIWDMLSYFHSFCKLKIPSIF